MQYVDWNHKSNMNLIYIQKLNYYVATLYETEPHYMTDSNLFS